MLKSQDVPTDYFTRLEISPEFSVFHHFCCDNTKLLDAMLTEVMDTMNRYLSLCTDPKSTYISPEIAYLVGLISAPFIISFQRSTEEVLNAPSTETGHRKRPSAAGGSLQTLSRLRKATRTVVDTVYLFDVLSEKSQRRMLTLVSKVIKYSCDTCVCIDKVLRLAGIGKSLKTSSKRRKTRHRYDNMTVSEVWKEKDNELDNIAESESEEAEEDDRVSDGNIVTDSDCDNYTKKSECKKRHQPFSKTDSKQISGTQRRYLMYVKELIGDHTELTKRLPILIEVLASSTEHLISLLNWSQQTIDDNASFLATILRRHNKLIKFSSIGVTLLSRIEEFLLRLSDLKKHSKLVNDKKSGPSNSFKVMS